MNKTQSRTVDGAFGGFLAGMGLALIFVGTAFSSSVSTSEVSELLISGFVVLLVGVLLFAFALHRGSKYTI